MYMYWYDIKNNLRENMLYCITIQLKRMHKHYVKASILNLAGKDVKSVKLVRVIDVCARFVATITNHVYSYAIRFHQYWQNNVSVEGPLLSIIGWKVVIILLCGKILFNKNLFQKC